MRRHRSGLLVASVLTASILCSATAVAATPERTYVPSIPDSTGTPLLTSSPLGLSANGRYVTLYSAGTGWIRYDRMTGAIKTGSLVGDVSADGRFTSYLGMRIDLSTGAVYQPPVGSTNGYSGISSAISDDGQVFLANSASGGWAVDLAAGTLTNLGTSVFAISADGRFVTYGTFRACANGNGCTQAFVHDRISGSSTPIADRSGYALVSGGGSTVVYTYSTNDLTGTYDLRVLDRATGRSRGLASDVPGIPVDAALLGLSDDGTRVLIQDRSDNMLYLADRSAGTVTPIGVSSTFTGVLSGDGSTVASVSLVQGLFRVTITELSGARSAHIAAGETVTVQVGGVGGVPADASAAVLNVTATTTSGPGYVTVWPCDADRPTTSNLNFTSAGATVPNAVITRLSAAGTACFYSPVALDVVVDVNGAFPASAAYTPLVPDRLYDSRNGETDLVANVAPGQVLTVQVAGRSGVPADATAAVLNVTATNTTAPGYVTVWPCDADRPTTSNLNFTAAAATVPNAVITRLSATGTACLYSPVALDVIVDVNGAVPAGSAYGPLVPARVFDSRNLS